MIQLIAFLLAPLEFFVFIYFMLINFGYMALNFLSLLTLGRYMQERSFLMIPEKDSMFKPPVSLIVPAYNEELTIRSSVNSLLQLSYPEYEVLIINDGSRDGTMKALIEEFKLQPFPQVVWKRLDTKPVRGVYHSTLYPNLIVIDKENGGKADALNAGLNIARYPLVCCMDGDSILQDDSLECIVEPFMQDPTTVAAGGTVRVVNGCIIRKGFREKTGLPKNLLALFQVVEYLRGFLFGRLGWSYFNALLIVSGAFGLFRKDVLLDIGGYRTNTIGEDMDITLRIHQHMREKKRPYRITFIPDPICWTEVPEDLNTLRNQRIRWQRGLAESLFGNKKLFLNPKGGLLSWVAIPFHFFFEWLGPLIESLSFVFVIVGGLFGFISPDALVIFLFVTVGLGVLLSVSALLLEEMSFHLYPKRSQIIFLFFIAILENFGYRQLNTLWRLQGFILWFFGRRQDAKWGEMRRVGAGQG